MDNIFLGRLISYLNKSVELGEDYFDGGITFIWQADERGMECDV